MLLLGCERHNGDDFIFYIRNQSIEKVRINSFNIDGSGFSGQIIRDTNETFSTGGGGILDVDSVMLIRQSDMDTIIYRNQRHGDDLSTPNHFFNLDSWTEEDTNKYFYNISDEDFDN